MRWIYLVILCLCGWSWMGEWGEIVQVWTHLVLLLDDEIDHCWLENYCKFLSIFSPATWIIWRVNWEFSTSHFCWSTSVWMNVIWYSRCRHRLMFGLLISGKAGFWLFSIIRLLNFSSTLTRLCVSINGKTFFSQSFLLGYFQISSREIFSYTSAAGYVENRKKKIFWKLTIQIFMIVKKTFFCSTEIFYVLFR